MTITHDNDERPVKIGIACTTTPCRKQVFEQWYIEYLRHCSDIYLYVHNDVEYKGVAYSKNKCIADLYDKGCTHLFFFDDDCIIQSPDFIQAYCNSGLNHACWNLDRNKIGRGYLKFNVVSREYSGSDFIEYQTPNGCMLYARLKVIDTVGGFDTDFKGYAFDHVNWTDRIYNNGLTPARYLDIPSSSHLFKMANCKTSISNEIRHATIEINRRLYQQKYYSKEFKPFR